MLTPGAEDFDVDLRSWGSNCEKAVGRLGCEKLCLPPSIDGQRGIGSPDISLWSLLSTAGMCGDCKSRSGCSSVINPCCK